MENYIIPSYWDESGEFARLLDSFVVQGNDHLSTLENYLVCLRTHFEKHEQSEGRESEPCKRIERIGLSVKEYIRRRKWFEEFRYPPKTDIYSYDFENSKAYILQKSLPDQKRFWEVALKEVEEFAIIHDYQFDNGMSESAKVEFTYSVKSELLKIDTFLAFENDSHQRKLVWYGKPSDFGYLFSQLQSLGWIGLQQGGEINYSKFARTCLELFDFKEGTTEGNLAKELNPTKQTLAEESRKRFNIPAPSELNPKRPKKGK